VDNPVEGVKDLLGKITVEFYTPMQGEENLSVSLPARVVSPHVEWMNVGLWMNFDIK
jgi:hypothetical protein